MNKTFTLSSVGQNPENFSCSLSKTEFIPPNHQIALLNLNMDTHTGTNHHYTAPEIGFKFHGINIGSNDRLYKQLETPELMADGTFADFVEYSRSNPNVIYQYYRTGDGNGVATLSNPGTAYRASHRTPDWNFSWQNNFDINQVPLQQTSGLLGPFGPDSTPLTQTANQLVKHTPLGNLSTWTTHIIKKLKSNEGYIEKVRIPNSQIPRAEFFVSMDNLPIENHISNNTFQGIVPSVYTHHNRFDNEADESIVPHHLIYHKLNNKGYLRIGKIDVSIRDNITNDILHPTTFSNPTNLTLHIKPI